MEVLEVNENKKRDCSLSYTLPRTFDFNYMHVPLEQNEF